MRVNIQKPLINGLAALFLLSVGMFSSVVSAAEGVASEKAQHHPVLQRALDQGGKVEFLGNAYGMDGWLIMDTKGGVQYAYTTPEGALLIGMLFGPDGSFETKKQLQAYRQKSDGSQAAAPGAEKSSANDEKLYADTEKAGWVAIGDSAAPYLYIYINVNCDHCQALWKDLEGSISGGRIQARLVPYGTAPENRDGGAALLSVDNPGEAWRAYVAGDKSALSKDKIKGDAYLKIDANTAIVTKLKVPPPLTLYRRPSNGEVTALVGRPENILLLQAEFLK